MSRRPHFEVMPRNSVSLQVLAIARISGCIRQREASLDDQIDHIKDTIAELYDGLVEYTPIPTKGKGEQLTRPELAQIEKLLRSRKLDFAVCEDLGRLVRGAEASRLLGVGVDNGTRMIAIHDGIDTAHDTWEQDSLTACSEHVGHNAHTSKRLKHKLMNRFMKEGLAARSPISGHVKLPDGLSFDDWRKVEEATPIIRKGAEMLLGKSTFSSVARYFNEQAFPTGLRCRRRTWDGAIVLSQPDAVGTAGARQETVGEGRHDVEFLQRISAILHAERPDLPDLAAPSCSCRPAASFAPDFYGWPLSASRSSISTTPKRPRSPPSERSESLA